MIIILQIIGVIKYALSYLSNYETIVHKITMTIISR